MNTTKMRVAGIGVLVAGALLGFSACGGGSSADVTEAPATSPSATAEPVVDVAEDLENARQAISDALAEDPSWTQIMLASDVQSPTVKYGMLVVPFVPSDASARVQGTIQIANGKFTIEAESAATGSTWQIDQDGAITEATD